MLVTLPVQFCFSIPGKTFQSSEIVFYAILILLLCKYKTLKIGKQDKPFLLFLLVSIIIWIFSNFDLIALRFVYFFFMLFGLLLGVQEIKYLYSNFPQNPLAGFGILTIVSGITQWVFITFRLVNDSDDWKRALQYCGLISSNIPDLLLAGWAGNNAISGFLPIHHEYAVLLGFSSLTFLYKFIYTKKIQWLLTFLAGTILLGKTESLTAQISFFVCVLLLLLSTKNAYLLFLVFSAAVFFPSITKTPDIQNKQSQFIQELSGDAEINQARSDRYFYEIETIKTAFFAPIPILTESSEKLYQRGVKPHSGFTMALFNFGILGGLIYIYYVLYITISLVRKSSSKNRFNLYKILICFYLFCGFGIGIFSSILFIPIIGISIIYLNNENSTRH